MDQRDHREAVARAEHEYGVDYGELRFITGKAAFGAERLRAELLDRMGKKVHTAAGGTKIFTGVLSPGCKSCVAGSWSCLFISGRCNTRCFYCPSPQDEQGEPMTNSVPFPKVSEYVDYVARFGFHGVSISGGEPLLTPEKTLAFARAVKRRFGDAVHLWLYTNGTKLDRKMASALADAGLDELRIDIGATAYSLDAVHLAAEMIPRITVEIPAIPEDVQLLTKLLPTLIDSGVDHLNLHQLRMTPHNFSKLVGRNYTYLHGDKVTVLESEQAALGLIEQVVKEQLELPTNYCSYTFKHRYQRVADRQRAASVIRSDSEDVVETGHLRCLWMIGEPAEIAVWIKRLRRAGETPHLSRDRRLKVTSGQLAKLLPFDSQPRFAVQYLCPRILPAMTYRNPFAQVSLGNKRKLFAEKAPTGAELLLTPSDALAFTRLVLEGVIPSKEERLGSDTLPILMSHERIETGLASYF